MASGTFPVFFVLPQEIKKRVKRKRIKIFRILKIYRERRLKLKNLFVFGQGAAN
jgi:hypothetical protein